MAIKSGMTQKEVEKAGGSYGRATKTVYNENGYPTLKTYNPKTGKVE